MTVRVRFILLYFPDRRDLLTNDVNKIGKIILSKFEKGLAKLTNFNYR